MSARRAIGWLLTAAVLLAAGDAAAAATAAKAPHLTKKHTGWRKTDCASCHDAAAMARKHANAAGLAAPQCGRCHGYNGAPHEGHAVRINPCLICHSTVAHTKAFRAPDDCTSCHVHPDNPKGR